MQYQRYLFCFVMLFVYKVTICYRCSEMKRSPNVILRFTQSSALYNNAQKYSDKEVSRKVVQQGSLINKHMQRLQ